MSENIIPIFAHTFFSVSRDGEFHQLLTYDYYDPDKYYLNLESTPEEYEKEIEKLWLNMQGYLEEEINQVNGERVYPKVIFTDLQFRGSENTPFILWIISFKGKFKEGENIYKTVTEEEVLEYDCDAIWTFPEDCEILSVTTPMDYEIMNNILLLWAKKGDKIGGHEEIRFRF
ncbi:MAG: hypothetical protein ACUVXA_20625 [Candidatus Jordarchaeum sp.]|uniref:hypothetical protein n=1 Tax=Candidatus Jordarchaeum sp. TaxID=2823881 RepID=UPI0040498F51